MRTLALIVVMVLVAIARPARVVAQAADNPPCWHADFAAMSFLRGEWTVRVEDRLGDGRWETSEARCWITPDFHGCALIERYTGTRDGKRFDARGMYGYNSVAGALQHVWIDGEHGMLTTYEGRKVGDDIVLIYRMVLRGQPTLLRDVYSEIAENSFRVEGSRSTDNENWDVTSRMHFTRVVPPTPPAPLPSVELPADLARVLTDYEVAWTAGDEAALAALFAEDGYVLPGGGTPVKGREAIRKHYRESSGPLSLRALAWSVEGSVGYIIGGYASARGENDIGKFTLTLRKGGDGRWLIVSDMDNSNRN